MAVSQPGLLFISSQDGTGEVNDFVGRTFFAIASGETEVLALCNDGIHGVGINEVSEVSNQALTTASSGRGFFIGIDAKNDLYSWGSAGHTGQV
jgi:hypothetical protein